MGHIRRPALEAPSSWLSLDKNSSSMGPSHTQALRLNKMCLMYSYAQDKHLIAKTTLSPDGRWWRSTRRSTADPTTKDRTTLKITPARGLNESSQGPRRCHSRTRSSSSGDPTKYKQAILIQIGQLLGCCSYIAVPSTQRYGTRRRCRRSRIDGGGLLKAAQKNSFAGPSGHQLLHIYNCNLLVEVHPGAQCVIYKRLYK